MRTYPKRRLILGLAILAVSLLLLLWGLWPTPDAVRTVPVFPADMQLPTPQSGLPLNAGEAVGLGDAKQPRSVHILALFPEPGGRHVA